MGYIYHKNSDLTKQCVEILETWNKDTLISAILDDMNIQDKIDFIRANSDTGYAEINFKVRD